MRLTLTSMTSGDREHPNLLPKFKGFWIMSCSGCRTKKNLTCQSYWNTLYKNCSELHSTTKWDNWRTKKFHNQRISRQNLEYGLSKYSGCKGLLQNYLDTSWCICFETIRRFQSQSQSKTGKNFKSYWVKSVVRRLCSES